MANNVDQRTQDRQASAQSAQGSLSDTSQGQEGTPLSETIVGILGLLLVLSVIGYLIYQGIMPQEPPAIVLEATNITAYEAGYLMEIEVSNRGGSTAEGLVVTGELMPVDQSGAQGGNSQPVESAEATFDYVPPHSSRRGGLLFQHDPSNYKLELDVSGYTTP